MIFLRRLDRYVMGQFLKTLVLSLFSLTLIYVLVHLMDHVNIYLDNDADWLDVGRYYLFQTPYSFLLTLPMAMLISTILSIGDLGRYGELTAMKSSGISLFRIVLPVLVFALFLSVGVLALGETVVPRLNATVNAIYEQEIMGADKPREDYRGNFVHQNEDGYTYIVRSLFVQPEGATGEQVEIQRRLEDGTFLRINAPQMLWEPPTGTWVLRDGELRVFPEGGDERMYGFMLLRSPDLSDPPDELLARDKEPEEMGYADLEEYIDKRERLGAETREDRVDLQMKVAYPFANLIITLFGVALVGSAAHASRQSGTVGFGLALFLTIVFWGFLRVSQGIGYGGGLPPTMAAWLANGIFGVVGLILLARART